MFTQGLRASFDFETFKATNDGYQEGKNRGLSHTNVEVTDLDITLKNRHEHGGGDIQ